MWTDEQLRAIKENGSDILVAAAAGSGKTAVLVERIINIICREDNPIDIDCLLVLTFTKAAAAQMRERISKTLSKKIEEEPDNRHLHRQLALINRAQITTIDSFCLKIVKENYMHIGLDPSVRTADEKECALIKSDVLEELFEDRYSAEDNSNFLKLVEIFGEATGDNSLKNLVLSVHGFVQSSPFPEQWLDMAAENFNMDAVSSVTDTIWGRFIFKALENEIDGLILKCNEAIETMEAEGTLPDSYIKALDSDRNTLLFVKRLVAENYDEAVDIIQNIKFANIGRIKAGVHSSELAEKIKASREEIKAGIKSIAKEFLFEYNEAAVSDIKETYPIIKELTGLVKEFDSRYKAVKKEKLLLDFSDMEHYALEVLLEKGSTVENPIPTKAALNMQERYYEVMTDEYQDSNMVQEMILRAVSGNKHNRFMVGDVKQSIYGFRQAEPSIFIEKFNTYNCLDGKVRIDLFKNFRSRANILEGINLIFSQLMGAETGGIEYNDKTALYPGATFPCFDKEEEQAPIEFYIIDRAEDYADNDDADDEEELNSAQLEMTFVANRIKALINERFQVLGSDGRYRDIRYGDIVILFRAAKNWSNAAAEALENAGIPVFAPTESPYFANTEVSFILSVLRVVDNARQDIPLMAALKSPVYGVTDDELVKIMIYGGKDNFYDNVELYAEKEDKDIINEKLSHFLEDIFRWKEQAVFTPVSTLLWTIYNETGYFDYIGIKENGAQRQANLKLLTQKAQILEETNFKGLFNFIRYIEKLEKFSEDNSEAFTLSENDNLVRITTIHKSKGLEYPVVFVCGLGKKFNRKDLSKPVLMNKELGIGVSFTDLEKRVKYNTISKSAVREKLRQEAIAEEIRVLYVALTRAKEKLILTGSSIDAEKFLNKISTSCGCRSTLLPAINVLKGTSYLEWLMAAMARHKEGLRLIDSLDIKREAPLSCEAVALYNNRSSWQLSVVKRQEISAVRQEEIVGDTLSEAYDGDLGVLRLLDFEYKHKDICALAANVSVSEIKRSPMADIDRAETEELVSEKKWAGDYKKPIAFESQKELTASQKGTALHTVMEHLDLKHIYTEEDIKKVIERLKNINILTEEEALSIRPQKIINFFKSPIGEMLRRAEIIYKEESFAMELTPFEVYGKKSYEDVCESMLTHGIVDCFFIADGKVVLYDYKTDYVPNDGEKDLVNKYGVQLEIYKNAVESTLLQKVDMVYIYSFYLDKAIELLI